MARRSGTLWTAHPVSLVLYIAAIIFTLLSVADALPVQQQEPASHYDTDTKVHDFAYNNTTPAPPSTLSSVGEYVPWADFSAFKHNGWYTELGPGPRSILNAPFEEDGLPSYLQDAVQALVPRNPGQWFRVKWEKARKAESHTEGRYDLALNVNYGIVVALQTMEPMAVRKGSRAVREGNWADVVFLTYQTMLNILAERNTAASSSINEVLVVIERPSPTLKTIDLMLGTKPTVPVIPFRKAYTFTPRDPGFHVFLSNTNESQDVRKMLLKQNAQIGGFEIVSIKLWRLRGCPPCLLFSIGESSSSGGNSHDGNGGTLRQPDGVAQGSKIVARGQPGSSAWWRPKASSKPVQQNEKSLDESVLEGKALGQLMVSAKGGVPSLWTNEIVLEQQGWSRTVYETLSARSLTGPAAEFAQAMASANGNPKSEISARPWTHAIWKHPRLDSIQAQPPTNNVYGLSQNTIIGLDVPPARTTHSISRKQIVPLHLWSDIAFLQWQKMANDQGKNADTLKYILFTIPTKGETFELLQAAILPTPPKRWPRYAQAIELRPADPGFFSMLDSGRGRWVAELLIRHKQQLGSARHIISVKIFSSRSSKQGLGLLFTISKIQRGKFVEADMSSGLAGGLSGTNASPGRTPRRPAKAMRWFSNFVKGS